MELAIQLDSNAAVPLHQQIYNQLRDAILTGQLRSHQRLPSSRYLAQTLGVSRTTITQSYDQLISEGYLEPRLGAGTFVSAQLPDELLKAYSPAACSDDNQTSALKLCDLSLSEYGDRLVKTPDHIYASETPLSFAYGVPDIASFPLKLWRSLCNRHASSSTDWMHYAEDPMGYLPLREQIAEYISQVRAVRCSPEQILVTSGTQQALSLIVRLLIRSESKSPDSIAIENPGYLSAKRIFSSSGASLVPVPTDANGLVLEGAYGLKSLSTQHPIKLVYVTPSHQFPTGVLMPLSRRLALLQWAQENSVVIVEDDYDSEFRYSGRPTPALQGLDRYDQVLYVGTFSKVMFPGLRLGYVVLPPALIDLFRRSKWLCDRQCSLLNQQALADFIAQGHMAKHIRRMRSLYAIRRKALTRGLTAAFLQSQKRPTPMMASSVNILGDESGLHVMAQLPLEKSDDQVISEAEARGVTLFSAQGQYWHRGEPNPETDTYNHSQGAFIFGFGNISEKDICEAIARLHPVFSSSRASNL